MKRTIVITTTCLLILVSILSLTACYGKAPLKDVEYTDYSDWISNKISLDTHIKDITLPGTHDSNAIGRKSILPVILPMLDRQELSITDQLNSGIRLFDIRIKVVPTSDGYDILTCHSDFLDNEYQSFVSVLEEVELFLSNHSGEFVAISLKVDNWTDVASENKQDALDKIWSCLDTEIYLPFADYVLSEVQGKAVIINRLGDHDIYGKDWQWNHNAVTDTTVNGAPVHIQDAFEYLIPSDDNNKMNYLKEEIQFKLDHPEYFSINFVSHTFFVKAYGDSSKEFIEYVTSTFNGKSSLGWFLMDFSNKQYNTANGEKKSSTEILIELN